MDSFYLGHEWNPKTGRVGRTVDFDMRSHLTMIAPTGASKGVSMEVPNLLLGLRHVSVINPDPSGQNAAVTAEARRKAGNVVQPLNPMGLHVERYPDLQSVGFNCMSGLDPRKPKQFFKRSVAIAEAMITVDNDSQKFFPESARGLAAWLIQYVKIRDGDKAHLGTVRDIATEAEKTDDDGNLIAGLRFHAARAVVSMGRQYPHMASLGARFMKDSRSNGDIVSTFDTQTRWLLDDDIRADLSVTSGIDFARLKDRPTTVFLILPAGTELEFFAPWLRIVITCAFDALYERGGEDGVETVFMLSEFAQICSGGVLKPITAALGQARKYGVRLAPIVLQNVGQLRELFGADGTDTFLANSGCVFGFSPGNSVDTAEFMSRLSDEHGVISLSASDDPDGGPARVTVSEKQERVWPPGKIRSLPERHGLVWKAGKSQPQPVYCPPFWEIAACRRLARRDPYHRGESSTRGLDRKATGAIGTASWRRVNGGDRAGLDGRWPATGAAGNPLKPKTFGAVTAPAKAFQARIDELEAERATLAAALRLSGVKTWLAGRFDPDLPKHRDANEAERQWLTGNLQKVNAAYAVLERRGGQ